LESQIKEVKQEVKQVKEKQKPFKALSVLRPNLRTFVGATPVSQALRSAVSHIVAPAETGPVRIGNAFGAEPTCAAAPAPQISVDFPSSGTKDTSFFMFRDAARSFIFQRYVDTLTEYQTDWDDISPTGSAIILGGGTYDVNCGPAYKILPTDDAEAAHGPVAFPGRLSDPQLDMFWLQNGQTMSLEIQSGAAWQIGTTLKLMKSIDGEALKECDSFSGDGTTKVKSFLITWGEGYYGWQLIVNQSGVQESGPMRVGFSIPAETWIWAHLPIPGILSNLNSVTGIQVNAVAMLLTNNASEMVRNGSVLQRQLGEGAYWQKYTSYASVAEARGLPPIPLVNGFYHFLKPTCPDDFEWQKVIDADANPLNPNRMWYPIKSSFQFAVMAIKLNVDGNFSGQDMTLTLATGFEYTSPDRWREAKPAALRNHEFLLMIELLRYCPTAHENPFHMKDLANFLKKAVTNGFEWVRQNPEKVLSGIGTIAKYAAPLLL